MKLSLDLHGIKHEDARRQTIAFVEANWNSNKTVEIITGHSYKMREVVSKVLDEYKLDYKVGGELDVDLARILVLLD